MEFTPLLDAEAAQVTSNNNQPDVDANDNGDINLKAASRYIDEHDLPLPKGSGWGIILSHQTSASAAVRAAELGLPEDATWRDIAHHLNIQINPQQHP